MSGRDGYEQLFVEETAFALGGDSRFDARGMTQAERATVTELGRRFAKRQGGVWLLISGRLTSGNGQLGTEDHIRDMLRRAFGYPKPDGSDRTLNVLLNSPGGSLDSAYSTALYLSAYAKELNVYVPDRAKSASTLLAVGADRVYMSAFGELGPLDTQIPDPRNPANTVSALDCYQSVDYVRDFGFNTVTEVLPQLVRSTERRIPVRDLLDTASAFALGAISPVLATIKALDFGAWGRSLRIGEHYARQLLQIKAEDGDLAAVDRIADRLVYGYNHHLFPIDYHEAERIGLRVAWMDEDLYDGAIKVVDACRRKDFVGFLSEEQAATVPDPGPAPNGQRAYEDRTVNELPGPEEDPEMRDQRPQADTNVPRAWGGRDFESERDG